LTPGAYFDATDGPFGIADGDDSSSGPLYTVPIIQVPGGTDYSVISMLLLSTEKRGPPLCNSDWLGSALALECLLTGSFSVYIL
jgi:hypothetical protein